MIDNRLLKLPIKSTPKTSADVLAVIQYRFLIVPQPSISIFGIFSASF